MVMHCPYVAAIAGSSPVKSIDKMNDEDILRVMLKQEMKLALDQFKTAYKKVSKGIEKIYTEANLTNDLKEVQRLHSKFFGYIQKSKNAKDKWKDL